MIGIHPTTVILTTESLPGPKNARISRALKGAKVRTSYAANPFLSYGCAAPRRLARHPGQRARRVLGRLLLARLPRSVMTGHASAVTGTTPPGQTAASRLG